MAKRVKQIMLDFQHINKPNHQGDRGASYVSKPASKDSFSEVDIVIDYMNRIRMGLEANGHRVVFGFSGTYPQRHKFINENFPKADLYIAGHINAGGGRYARIEIDKRASAKTNAMAEFLWERFNENLPISKCDIINLGPRDRGFSCIGGVHCSALLLEPLFIDYPQHRKFMRSLDGTQAIANAVVEAVELWNVEY